jgi:hypothetical protein
MIVDILEALRQTGAQGSNSLYLPRPRTHFRRRRA